MKHAVKNDIKHQDYIEDAIGPMGRWQIIITVALALKSFPVAWIQLGIAVIAPGQDFTCVSPAPINVNDTMLKACFVKIDENLPEVPCTNFTYDDSTFKSTIISEWDLVCDRKFLRSLVQPLTQSAILVGNLVFGIVADRIGRKKPLIFAVTVQALAGITTSFMTTFELFLLFKLISSVATGGAVVICIVIVIEIVGTRHRSIVMILYGLPFMLGFLTVPLFSYLTKTWNGYWLMISVPSLLLLSYYWLIPESPRWLLARGKVEQARQILLKAAKRNKLSEEGVKTAIESHDKLLTSVKSKDATGERRKYNVIDLVRTPNMRIKTLFVTFNWFTGGFVFFGIGQYLGHMSKNVLTNLAISATFQLPGLLLVYILITRVPRLKILIGSQVLLGICILLIIPFYDNETVKLVLVSVAFVCMSVGGPTFHLYAGEVFPTVVRNIGMAFCSVSAKLGAIVSPFFITYIDDLAYWVVPLVYGLLPLVGAILCFWLPETKDCTLPDTIEDGENAKTHRTHKLHVDLVSEVPDLNKNDIKIREN